jgi:hypothetical protein
VVTTTPPQSISISTGVCRRWQNSQESKMSIYFSYFRHPDRLLAELILVMGAFLVPFK